MEETCWFWPGRPSVYLSIWRSLFPLCFWARKWLLLLQRKALFLLGLVCQRSISLWTECKVDFCSKEEIFFHPAAFKPKRILALMKPYSFWRYFIKGQSVWFQGHNEFSPKSLVQFLRQLSNFIRCFHWSKRKHLFVGVYNQRLRSLRRGKKKTVSARHSEFHFTHILQSSYDDCSFWVGSKTHVFSHNHLLNIKFPPLTSENMCVYILTRD